MQVTRHELTITTDASGDFTGYITSIVSGFVHQIRYSMGTLANTADLDVTLRETGVNVLSVDNITASTTYLPRHVTHDNDDGSELVHATVGNAAGSDIDGAPVASGGEQLKVVVAQGGNTKTGTLYVWIVT